MYQQAAWLITIILSIGIISVFLYVVLNAGKKEAYEPIKKRWYRFRNVYFVILVLVLGIATVITLQDLPFAKAQEGNDEVVDVVAKQFAFELSKNEFKVGEQVAFNVTSADVNHGFGIYDENMILITQTQAMPEYTNTVYYTFDKPGTYTVFCLEYCGIGHHLMKATITVK